MNVDKQLDDFEIKKILRTDQNINEMLIKSDPKLKSIIDYCGPIEKMLHKDYFFALSRSIIGQQLSTKAARTILGRVINLLGGKMTPERILSVKDEELRSMGVSYSKIKYLKNLSKVVDNDILNLKNLEKFENEDVVSILTEVNGIGKWTAEMFLIFSLGRTDIFSLSDVGLQRSVMNLYKISEKPSKKQLAQISSKWKPYRTFASLYLWEAIDRKAYDVKNKREG
jgi:DNA-3-methyladenine glycosylase II